MVEASYHQVLLASLNSAPVLDPADVAVVATVVDDHAALVITTGCTDGPVAVQIQVFASRPPDPPEDALRDWEVCEAVSLMITGPVGMWGPTTGFPDPSEPEVFTPARPGAHRVRVSGRGRGVDYAAYLPPDSVPDERFLIEIWPEEHLRPRETYRSDGHRLDE